MRCLFFVHSRQTPGSPDPDRFVVAKIFTTKSIDRWIVRIQWTHHRGSPRKRNIAGRARKLNIKPLGQRHAQPSLVGWLTGWLVSAIPQPRTQTIHQPPACSAPNGMHIGVLNSILLAYPKHSAGTLARTRL